MMDKMVSLAGALIAFAFITLLFTLLAGAVDFSDTMGDNLPEETKGLYETHP